MIAPNFSLFLHALATELDMQAGTDGRDALLYSIGKRMALRLPLPDCETVEAFESECNALLTLIGWGEAHVRMIADRRHLAVDITRFPRVGALGEPVGHWLAALYGGLFEGWFLQKEEHVVMRTDPKGASFERMSFVLELG